MAQTSDMEMRPHGVVGEVYLHLERRKKKLKLN